ncbi:hypothetical protein CH063_04840 [Colletotrichum higginsianum]|uniref:Uncharacterized protein n=1 Tax=Colletotrichum higginsianum (strain IMI 349063) TaxID=759273 RepID=H1UWV1_COLHI|nr:hypothetical protein CH063_04840 [Colletotrichum higginsianum]
MEARGVPRRRGRVEGESRRRRWTESGRRRQRGWGACSKATGSCVETNDLLRDTKSLFYVVLGATTHQHLSIVEMVSEYSHSWEPQPQIPISTVYYPETAQTSNLLTHHKVKFPIHPTSSDVEITMAMSALSQRKETAGVGGGLRQSSGGLSGLVSTLNH